MTAFSNGTEWDAWAAGWCHRCACYDHCDIALRVLIENTVPPEWIPGPLALSPERSECSAFISGTPEPEKQQ